MPKDSYTFDRLRNKPIRLGPEEIIRQGLVEHLIGELGFPKELMAIEKNLSELPYLSYQGKLPRRRIDVLCYAKDLSIYPLLLIECKNSFEKKQALYQVWGYNFYIKAPFVALVAQNKRAFSSVFSAEVLNYIPCFEELCQIAKEGFSNG